MFPLFLTLLPIKRPNHVIVHMYLHLFHGKNDRPSNMPPMNQENHQQHPQPSAWGEDRHVIMLVKSIPVLVFKNMTRYMYTQSTVLCIPYTVPGEGENQYIILFVYFYLFTSDNNDIRNHPVIVERI